MKYSVGPLRTAAFYGAFGLLWVTLADALLLQFAPELALGSPMHHGPGLLGPLLAAAALFGIAHATRGRDAQAPDGAGPQLRTTGRRVLAAIWITVALVVLVASVMGLAHEARDERNRQVEQLRAAAQARSRQLDAWFHERRVDAEYLRLDGELPRLLARSRTGRDPAAQARLASQLEQYRRVVGYRQLLLVDGEGRVLAGAGAMPLPADAVLAATAREALAQQAVRLSDLHFADEARATDPSIALAVPLASADDSTAASPVAAVFVADPQAAFAPLPPAHLGTGPDTATSFFTRRDDDVLFLLPAAGGRAATVRRLPLGTSDLLAARTLRGEVRIGEAIDGVDTRGVPAFGVAARVGVTSWLLVQQVEQDAVYAPTRRAAAVVLAIEGGVLLALGAALRLLQQHRELDFARARRRLLEDKLRATRLLDGIAEGTADAITVRDREGRYLLMNRAARQRAGLAADAPLAANDAALYPPEQAAALAALDRQAFDASEGPEGAEGTDVPVRHALVLDTAGGPRHFDTFTAALRDAGGAANAVFSIHADVTERRRDEQRLRQMAMVFNGTRDGVIITDLQARIVATNHAFADITGYAEGEVLGRTPALLSSGRQDRAFYQRLWAALLAQGHWQGEIWNRRKSGEFYPEWLTISAARDDAGHATHYVAVFTDISRIKRREEELEHLAHYDPLTGLPNRLLLQSRLAHAIDRAKRTGRQVAVMFLDLDHFKTVNDSLGHAAGDELLTAVARRLQQRLRESDTLGRLGGDEFLAILDPADSPEAVQTVARHLLDALEAPVALGAQEVHVSASIGIALYPGDAETPAELMRNADAALYRAKEHGRHQFSFYAAEMNENATAKLDLEVALWRALSGDELLLHYQPKVEAATGRLVGAEALLRWRREDGTMVPPGVFIPLAETSSMIEAIGTRVTELACRQLRAWLDQGLAPVPVAINVSARQFRAGLLDDMVQRALHRHAIASELIELELTEGVLMSDPEAAVRLLARLGELGVKRSLDDFGTGYSSLAYLMRFEVDHLKIDQSFVRSLAQHAGARTIVDTIIDLAHRMQLRVIAEGVETQSQLDHLVAQGCDVIQGYYFSPALPPEAFAELLRAGRCGPAPLPAEDQAKV